MKNVTFQRTMKHIFIILKWILIFRGVENLTLDQNQNTILY